MTEKFPKAVEIMEAHQDCILDKEKKQEKGCLNYLSKKKKKDF